MCWYETSQLKHECHWSCPCLVVVFTALSSIWVQFPGRHFHPTGSTCRVDNYPSDSDLLHFRTLWSSGFYMPSPFVQPPPNNALWAALIWAALLYKFSFSQEIFYMKCCLLAWEPTAWRGRGRKRTKSMWMQRNDSSSSFKEKYSWFLHVCLMSILPLQAPQKLSM